MLVKEFSVFEVLYHVRKSPSLLPVLKQMNSVHTLPFCFFKIYFYFYLNHFPILCVFNKIEK